MYKDPMQRDSSSSVAAPCCDQRQGLRTTAGRKEIGDPRQEDDCGHEARRVQTRVGSGSKVSVRGSRKVMQKLGSLSGWTLQGPTERGTKGGYARRSRTERESESRERDEKLRRIRATDT